MIKKILLIVGGFLVLATAALFYMNYRNRTLSPPGKASLANGGLSVEIAYSRPSVRDRLIFGTENEGALQPYGVYWRLGANEATEITLSQDVLFNGEPLTNGTYRLYAIPAEGEFEIHVNSELGEWGALGPEEELDVLVTSVPVKEQPLVEQFTVSLEKLETEGLLILFEWSDVRFDIPVYPAQ